MNSHYLSISYKAIVKKRVIHSYAHPDRFEVWFNMVFMPLMYEDGDTCYCTYTMEINFTPDSENLSSTAGETAAKVLETCIKLRGTTDFLKTTTTTHTTQQKRKTINTISTSC